VTRVLSPSTRIEAFYLPILLMDVRCAEEPCLPAVLGPLLELEVDELASVIALNADDGVPTRCVHPGLTV
jgi:hypothetical protein